MNKPSISQIKAHKRFKSLAAINYDSNDQKQINMNLDGLEKNQCEVISPKMGKYQFTVDQIDIPDVM